MIYFIDGILEEITDTFVVMNVHGVGYQLFVPSSDRQPLPSIGQSIRFYTYHHIREDAQTLYGFLSQEDRQLFGILTSVSGIGPKVAISILSRISVTDCISSIISEDLLTLSSIPGLGKKTAQRLIVELKDKLPKLMPAVQLPSSGKPSSAPAASLGNLEADLSLALKTLGYSADEIKRSIKAAASQLQPDMTLEAAIKTILKHI